MKQKRQVVLLVVLLMIAAGIWFWYFRKNQPGAPSETGNVVQDYNLLPLENPQIRFEEIERARKTEYKSTGRNIFSAAALAPQGPRARSGDPPAMVVNNPCGIYGPCVPPPPVPPKLPPNIKYFGYGIVPNGTSRRAFFHDTNGDDVYVIPEGELLLNRYRILRIGNSYVEFEELSSGRRGTAPLEEQAGPNQ